jgi:hypothetical protein
MNLEAKNISKRAQRLSRSPVEAQSEAQSEAPRARNNSWTATILTLVSITLLEAHASLQNRG